MTSRVSTPPPQIYPGTTSTYGPTRADSIGQSVPQYAFMTGLQNKAYNAKLAQQSMLGKVGGKNG